MLWLFWTAAVFLAYTFVGYPTMLGMISLFRKRGQRQETTTWAKVSIIIPAHNQAIQLRRKIENTLALTYPKEKREIIVASDASTDETTDIVRSCADRGVRLVELPVRKGKHHAQMVARDASQGEILVFTDVSAELEPDALQKIVANFADPSVGCVSSEDRIAATSGRWMGEGFYVEFEMWLRRLEASAGSLVGLSGSFFAARREVCGVWYPGLSSDFFLPLQAVSRGMRAIVDPECRGHYGLVHSEKMELKRKVRTIVHGLAVLFVHAALLNPFRYGFFSIQLISHKLFRWLVPFAGAALLVSNLFLWDSGMFYRVCLVLQLILYGTGVLALLAGRLTQFKPFHLARFFLLGNAATMMAWMYFLMGEKFVTWQPTRRS
jgi:glycosyltransferase involved in cell wall biosynthesis